MTTYEAVHILQPIVHYGLHFLFPGLLAWLFFREKWQKIWLIMVLTMLVDADHLLADPIFDPNRCSVGFHLLHSYPFVAIYFVCMFIPKTRVVGIALMLHMFTDFQDCLWAEWLAK